MWKNNRIVPFLTFELNICPPLVCEVCYDLFQWTWASRTSTVLPVINSLPDEIWLTRFELLHPPILFVVHSFISFILHSSAMVNDLPTTIYVPTSFQDDKGFEDDCIISDDDDLSLTREMVRSHCRKAPETRRGPPRTVSLESSRHSPRRTYSTCSESPRAARVAPMRTKSGDSFRTPVNLMATMTLDSRGSSLPYQGHRMSPTQQFQVPREISMEEQTQPSAAALNPLDVMYREGLKKLARSMKHSDMTRSVIKRTSSKYSYRNGASPSITPFYLQKQRDSFFHSSRCEEVEQTRRQLFDMIQGA